MYRNMLVQEAPEKSCIFIKILALFKTHEKWFRGTLHILHHVSSSDHVDLNSLVFNKGILKTHLVFKNPN